MTKVESGYPLTEDASLPRMRLRRASIADADKLAALAAGAGTPDARQLSERIEHGGALYYEADQGPLSLISWRDVAGGWDLAECSAVGGEDVQGHTRWLMTEVEALAIRLNVPRLSVTPSDEDGAARYRRMGYEPDADNSGRLSKRVGGQWQFRAAA